MLRVAEAYDDLFPTMTKCGACHDTVINLTPPIPHVLTWHHLRCRPPYRVIDANRPLDMVLSTVKKVVLKEVVPILPKQYRRG